MFFSFRFSYHFRNAAATNIATIAFSLCMCVVVVFSVHRAFVNVIWWFLELLCITFTLIHTQCEYRDFLVKYYYSFAQLVPSSFVYVICCSAITVVFIDAVDAIVVLFFFCAVGLFTQFIHILKCIHYTSATFTKTSTHTHIHFIMYKKKSKYKKVIWWWLCCCFFPFRKRKTENV